MTLLEKGRQLLGRILLDGGFLSNRDLEIALAEQKRTNELLGEILIRMGAVSSDDIKAALSVQDYLGSIEESIRVAAGMRQTLGSLLFTAGHITDEQLENALTVQKTTGEKLGEIFTRTGILEPGQLDNLLAFQQNQGNGAPVYNPFRLGEILVTTGCISRVQLDAALAKQSGTSKKLGEVLVENGYLASHHISHGMQLQQHLITAALATILACGTMSLTGCGAGGGTDSGATQKSSSASTTSNTSQQALKSNYLTVSSDDYSLAIPTFYYSTANDSFLSIQANIAKNVTDIDTRCVIRIDVSRVDGAWPQLNKSFAIEDGAQLDKFPGMILVFNGQASSMNKVKQGTITFSADSTVSDRITGSYDVIMTDYASKTQPVSSHHLKGSFSFKVGEYGQITQTAS
jgi:hypothetical protein